ncbi:MAG: TPM domain-containing protein [Planctomycetaceae bacterium]|nr:TPM domain-containing protein [Planctomycetaceae bacterium]
MSYGGISVILKGNNRSLPEVFSLINQIQNYSSRTFISRSMLLTLIFSSVGFLSMATPAWAQFQISLERPPEGQYIVDKANLITPHDKEEIRTLANEVLKDKAAPIIVVTIESMSQYGGAGLRIETFARLLFDQWGIGPAKLGDNPWNYGILLLVSRDDRKARIELGAGWKRDKDAQAQQIMDELIVPQFKAGNFSSGILAGVQGLDKMARDLELPRVPRPMSHYVIGAIFVGLLIFTVVSLIRRGSSGWAWLFWGVVFTIIGAVLYHMASNRGGGGGGYSGGSFGGGFSGGGGATGSW